MLLVSGIAGNGWNAASSGDRCAPLTQQTPR